MEAASELGPAVVMRGLFESRYHEVAARSNGKAYRVFVGGPVRPFMGPGAAGDGRFPAIYVLDAKLNFAIVHAQVQLLSALRQMPPAYVVGIGYAGDEGFLERDGFERQADLTPSAGGEPEADMRTMNGGAAPGGAEPFLAFLRDELRPGLEAAYPINDADATILGHSLGGLFASWVLFRQPSLFRRHVIVSPSWWWNDQEVWRWEARHAAAHDDLAADVFAAFGGLETADRHRGIVQRNLELATGEVRASLDRTLARSDRPGWMQGAELIPVFRERLTSRAYPSLGLTALVLPDETHESIPGPAFSRGLRAVFGSWSPDPVT